MSKPEITILYVEDDEGDRFFMEHAFQADGLGLSLRLVTDGKAALEYLTGAGIYSDRTQHPVPQFVLLDLKLPHMSGFEVLEWIRKNPEYSSLPVVILSSSALPEDRQKAQDLGANEYVQKPGSGLQYGQIILTLRNRWLSTRVSTN